MLQLIERQISIWLPKRFDFFVWRVKLICDFFTLVDLHESTEKRSYSCFAFLGFRYFLWARCCWKTPLFMFALTLLVVVRRYRPKFTQIIHVQSFFTLIMRSRNLTEFFPFDIFKLFRVLLDQFLSFLNSFIELVNKDAVSVKSQHAF